MLPLNIEKYLRAALSLMNFVGLIGLLAQEWRIVVGAAAAALLIDFLASERKILWPLTKPLWLLPAAAGYGVLNHGLSYFGSALPGSGWPLIAIVGAIVVFNGAITAFLDSLVAWSEEYDRHIAQALNDLHR